MDRSLNFKTISRKAILNSMKKSEIEIKEGIEPYLTFR